MGLRLFVAVFAVSFASGVFLPYKALGVEFDRNVSLRLKTQVMDDFQFMQSVVALKESPIHQSIFGKLDGANYHQWFESRVFYFGVDRCGGGGSVACVKYQYPNKIWVTGNYINISHPQVARLMTLYHEARHTEESHWPHARCPGNFPYRSIWTGRSVAGNYACDDNEFGSYASASVLLNNISKFCANCSEKVKEDAKLYSDDQVKRIVDVAAAARVQQDFSY